MITAPSPADLLYPLTLFHAAGAAPLPVAETIPGERVPEPYRSLLVHHGDMTSRLESFHRGRIELEVLHREHTSSAYRREVILRMQGTGLAVEYGAIEIVLEAFAPALREQILAEHLPLGGLLNSHHVRYHSRPKAFIKLASDVLMSGIFDVPPGHDFFGRCNELLDERDQVLARIVEVLRP